MKPLPKKGYSFEIKRFFLLLFLLMQYNLLNAMNENAIISVQSKNYPCIECPKQFNYKSQLRTHMYTHTDEKPFRCAICDKKFTTASHLKQHMLTHTGEKPFKCETCKHGFTTNRARNNHILGKHMNIKPFACDKCDKMFSCKANLTKHILKIHDDIKPHVCITCEKSFFTKWHLQQHILTHNEIIDDENVKYLCDQCGRKFIGASLLKTHKRVHTGARPFACTFCEKSFTQSGNLTRHIQEIHIGMKRLRSQYTDYCSEENSVNIPVIEFLENSLNIPEIESPTSNDYPLQPVLMYDCIYFFNLIK
jgi:uncharacterized Zn-finger protein